jgi:hypothetical protein
MNIKTEARIHVFFDKFKVLIMSWEHLTFIAYLDVLIVLTTMVLIYFGFNFDRINVIGILMLPFSIFILLLFITPIYAIFVNFFANINFSHNYILLCHLLLKKNHSSSKLDLELNKLKQAIENKSQLYNDLSKSDFPYINKFISRYYRYNNNYSHKKINHTSVKDDLLQLVKSESNIQPLMLENKSSFEQLDDVLGNLVKEQIKQKTVVNNK